MELADIVIIWDKALLSIELLIQYIQLQRALWHYLYNTCNGHSWFIHRSTVLKTNSQSLNLAKVHRGTATSESVLNTNWLLISDTLRSGGLNPYSEYTKDPENNICDFGKWPLLKFLMDLAKVLNVFYSQWGGVVNVPLRVVLAGGPMRFLRGISQLESLVKINSTGKVEQCL